VNQKRPGQPWRPPGNKEQSGLERWWASPSPFALTCVQKSRNGSTHCHLPHATLGQGGQVEGQWWEALPTDNSAALVDSHSPSLSSAISPWSAVVRDFHQTLFLIKSLAKNWKEVGSLWFCPCTNLPEPWLPLSIVSTKGDPLNQCSPLYSSHFKSYY
jgi:hypothetical protein